MEGSKFNTEMLDLIERKDFADLSENEKNILIQNNIQEDTYKLMRSLLDKTENLKELSRPVENIRNQLLQQFNAKYPGNYQGFISRLTEIASYKVPVFQPALVLMVAALTIFFLNRNSNQESKPEYITLRDTVYIEVPAVLKDSLLPASNDSGKKHDSAEKEPGTRKVMEKKEESSGLLAEIKESDIKVTDFKINFEKFLSLEEDSSYTKFIVGIR